jgi:hypothetical protein
MIGEPAALLGQQIEALREAIQRVGAVAQQPAEPQSSVEISQNAKGATQIAVKVYHRDPVEASTLAQGLYDQLAHRYGGTDREREL